MSFTHVRSGKVFFISTWWIQQVQQAFLAVVALEVVGVRGNLDRRSPLSAITYDLAVLQVANPYPSKAISMTCAIIHHKYLCQNLCHMPEYAYGFGDPSTWLVCMIWHCCEENKGITHFTFPYLQEKVECFVVFWVVHVISKQRQYP